MLVAKSHKIFFFKRQVIIFLPIWLPTIVYYTDEAWDSDSLDSLDLTCFTFEIAEFGQFIFNPVTQALVLIKYMHM